MGIGKNDLLVVDRQAEAINWKAVITDFEGELRVMKLVCREGKTYLAGDKKEITGKEYVYNLGVVTWILRWT